MRTTFPVMVALLAALSLVSATRVGAIATSPKQHPFDRITVGPNILVDHDFNGAHGESLLAINPRNGKNLIDASMTYARTDEGIYIKTYSSADGGYTWDDAAPLGDRAFVRSWDPQLAFGVSGTAYLVMFDRAIDGRHMYDGLGRKTGTDGHTIMELYRSTDGGLTWLRPTRLPSGDHAQIAVDRNNGRYRGRIYVTAPGSASPGDPPDSLYLYRSDDDGRTFGLRKVVVPGRAVGEDKSFDGYAGAEGLAVLNDGTLVVGIGRTSGFRTAADPHALIVQHFSTVYSTDGGNSFSPEYKIADGSMGTRDNVFAGATGNYYHTSPIPTWMELTADSSRSPYSNRIYATWPVVVAGHARVYVSYSKDRGRSWAPPSLIGTGGASDENDHQAIAVNNRGVVGLSFHHALASLGPRTYNIYFAASTNGGRSWIPATRVSSQTSFPASPGNLQPGAESLPGSNPPGSGQMQARDLQGLGLSYHNEFGESAEGGDYMGLAADSGGAFHALWQDSRYGTFHLYTARITVARGSRGLRRFGAPTSLNAKLTLSVDPGMYDPKTGDYILPIRLKNTSMDVIGGPLTVRLTQFESPVFKTLRPIRGFAVLNAPNKARGIGAAFDYTGALGGSGELLPGTLTDAVAWRIHLENPAALGELFLKFDVQGSLETNRPG